MPRPVRTLLAGTIAAIPLFAICTPATSQSTVDNDQVQLGDVFAGQQLNVVTTPQTTATTTATGDAFIAAVATGGLSVKSRQSLAGSVGAQTVVNVSQYSGQVTSLTAGTGVTGDADISGGGFLSATVIQTTGAVSVSGVSQLNASNAQVGSAQVQDQAIANSQGFAVAGSALGASVAQSNDSSVTATGGAIVGFIPGSALFSAAAVGQNVTSTGAGAAQSLDIGQANGGPLVQAVQTTQIGNGSITLTNATASANNVNVVNSGGPLAVATRQDNTAAVYAGAQQSSYQYGSATVTAQGVGNSTLAETTGGGVALDNVQLNGFGGVSAQADFTGGTGYDQAEAATAMGNAATAFSCSQCGGVMNVTNSQTNGSAVVARSVGGASGAARSVTGSATAVGNSGSFFVSSPGD